MYGHRSSMYSPLLRFRSTLSEGTYATKSWVYLNGLMFHLRQCSQRIYFISCSALVLSSFSWTWRTGMAAACSSYTGSSLLAGSRLGHGSEAALVVLWARSPRAAWGHVCGKKHSAWRLPGYQLASTIRKGHLLALTHRGILSSFPTGVQKSIWKVVALSAMRIKSYYDQNNSAQTIHEVTYAFKCHCRTIH